MSRYTGVVGVVALAWAGCAMQAGGAGAGSGSPPPLGGASGSGSASRGAEDNGQTGSPVFEGLVPVGFMCTQETNCSGIVASFAQGTLGARLPPSRFSGAECTRFTQAAAAPSGVPPASPPPEATPRCVCNRDDGGTLPLAPGNASGCVAFGHGGACLLTDDEAIECELDDAESCIELCDELDRRAAEDAERSYAFSVRFAECREERCVGVVQVDDRCFGHPVISNMPRSCMLSDEQIATPSEGGSTSASGPLCIAADGACGAIGEDDAGVP